MEDFSIRNELQSLESYQLNLKTLESQEESSLRFAAFDGELYSNAVLGEASFEVSKFVGSSGEYELLASAENLAQQDQPFLALSDRDESQFTLRSLEFSDLSQGSFNAVVTFGDGSVVSRRLDFDDAAQNQEMSLGLLDALTGPITRIDFEAIAGSKGGLLNHSIGITNLESSYPDQAESSLLFDLSADLTDAYIMGIGDLPYDAEIHLETARLKGLTTQTIEIDELPRLIGNEIIDFGQESIAELAVTGRYLNPTIGPVPFTPIELAELLRGDLTLSPSDIG